MEHLDIPVFGNGDIWGADDAVAMVNETGCAGVAIGRGCQGRPWIFADIRNAFEGSDARVRPTLGEVGAVVMRHARLLVEFFDGDERMAVHDLRKHIAWYLKGFPVGGSVRAAFMGCESLAEVQAIIDGLDQRAQLPERIVDKPRGRVRFAKKSIFPTAGWKAGEPRTPSVSNCLETIRWTRSIDATLTGTSKKTHYPHTTASAVLRNGLKTVKHVTFIDPSAIE